MRNRPVLYAGDPHGRFDHIMEAVGRTAASALVLLGDLEAVRPLEVELRSLIERGKTPIYWIPGNHDADSDLNWQHTWGSQLADRNIHGRVVTLPDGTRLAGLGGVFREAVWHPDPASARKGVPKFRTRAEHAAVTPRQDRWHGGHTRKHWGTIYPDEIDRLSELSADVLVTHEAPSYHPYGFSILDTLAQSLGVKVHIHGHHHDALDSSAHWPTQGFATLGVGLRGVSAIDTAGRCQVIVEGE